MTNQTQIPSEIAAIIEQKTTALQEARKQKEETDQRAAEEQILQGKIKVNAWIAQSMAKVPEWIRRYVVLSMGPELDYERIAHGWNRVEEIDLFFFIPGLADIQFDTMGDRWRSANASYREYEDDDEPILTFYNAPWRSDCQFVLIEAQEAMREHEQNLEQYAIKQEERARRFEQSQQEEQERQARANENEIHTELEHQKEQAEEQALFDAIKNDPIAIHMLKAFVFLRDERSTFEQRLYEADEAMSSIEGYWSNKASELRRQADQAQRRADDEKSRLQSDLDDAESKLVKEQRKNNGW